jgi:hypothetical protein
MSVETGYMLLTFFIIACVLAMLALVGSMVWTTWKDRHR